jgi:LmbE family N-acetylglucosaminyl deacetylase
MDTYSHVYLSPHLDDAAFSCGGRIWQQTQAGARVLVVTLFGSAPPPTTPLSPFAQSLHARWGHPADAILSRQEEDRAALAILGAEALHWPYTDCIYRQAPDGDFPYASESSLWGAIHPADESLVAELAGRIATLPVGKDGTLYAPLAAGRHVDHQITRRAVQHSGYSPVYYEDFPYAARDPLAVQAALGNAHRQAELLLLSKEALHAKITAIACYRSQLSTFWPGVAEMAASVRAFAEQVGNGKPAERYWRLVATASGKGQRP